MDPHRYEDVEEEKNRNRFPLVTLFEVNPQNYQVPNNFLEFLVVSISRLLSFLLYLAITTPRFTQAQLLRDPNKLYIDDIRLDLKGWELFFKENFFCSINKRHKVKACTAYMLYYLTIGRKFNFTSMIIYRMEEVIKKRKGPMPFAMLLTLLHNHILTTNPQAIVPIARKGKENCLSPVISSSSSSSDDNEAPSFLEFYDELSDSEDLTKAQREKRGMFKCLNRYVGTITKYLEKQK
ncbi:hypothetical protein Tco_0552803 [Tanacetum coccineum]